LSERQILREKEMETASYKRQEFVEKRDAKRQKLIKQAAQKRQKVLDTRAATQQKLQVAANKLRVKELGVAKANAAKELSAKEKNEASAEKKLKKSHKANTQDSNAKVSKEQQEEGNVIKKIDAEHKQAEQSEQTARNAKKSKESQQAADAERQAIANSANQTNAIVKSLIKKNIFDIYDHKLPQINVKENSQLPASATEKEIIAHIKKQHFRAVLSNLNYLNQLKFMVQSKEMPDEIDKTIRKTDEEILRFAFAQEVREASWAKGRAEIRKLDVGTHDQIDKVFSNNGIANFTANKYKQLKDDLH
jgi:hypothetical protein